MKNNKTSLALLVGSFAAVAMTLPVKAQTLKPVPMAPGPTPALPGNSCTAEALNVSGIVTNDGRVSVFNVPTNQGQFRVRVSCKDPFGATLTGQSALVTPVAGGPVNAGPISFGANAPIPATMKITPAIVEVAPGSAQQLLVQGKLPNQQLLDVTASINGTTYKTSNPNVATVSAEGIITAVGNGTAIVGALHEGALGLTTVRVQSAALSTLSVIPATLSLSINPAFGIPPIPLKVLGTLADAKEIDRTLAATGTTYVSSNSAVAVVGPDGAVAGVGSGTANLTVKDTKTGIQTIVPITVAVFSPQPLAGYNTPGWAYNADIDGTNVFIADGGSGLQIHNAFTGALVGKIAILKANPAQGVATVYDVKLRAKLAALALGNDGFALVDVTNPTNPIKRTTTVTGGYVSDLSISGDRLYLASSNELRVYDITNPTAPSLVGSLALGAQVNAVSADTARGLAVVVTNQPSLKIIDTGKAPPWTAISVPLPSATNQADDVTLSGTSVYVANGKNGIREFDVTNPTAPVAKASSTLTFNALGVAVRNTPQGTLIAAADNNFYNAVPLFNKALANTFTINYQGFPNLPQADADSNGIALGNGFGVVTVGGSGFQVFRTQQITENAGIAPTISLSKPLGGTSVLPQDQLLIDATAFDDIGVEFVDFKVDGQIIGGDGEAPFTAVYTPSGACGAKQVIAVATDIHGNIATSLPVSIKVKCADGLACAANADCASGLCAGVCQPCSAGNYASCKSLKQTCPNVTSGTYQIDPDGAGGQAAFNAYCNMSIDGGGWTLAGKMTNKDAKTWIASANAWTGTTAIGTASNTAADQDARSLAWGSLSVQEMMLSDTASLATGLHVRTTSGCIGNQPLSQFFTAALTQHGMAPNYQYKKCTVQNNYVPAWTTEPNWLGGQGPTSPGNSLNQGYMTIGKTDDFWESMGVISFYVDGPLPLGPTYQTMTAEEEADVGLGVSNVSAGPFGNASGFQQDIGGPSSCAGNDMTCATAYPQTVLLFIR